MVTTAILWDLCPGRNRSDTKAVDGNGRNPGRKELLTVGIAAGMKKEVCIESMDMVEKCVKNMLGRYL